MGITKRPTLDCGAIEWFDAPVTIAHNVFDNRFEAVGFHKCTTGEKYEYYLVLSRDGGDRDYYYYRADEYSIINDTEKDTFW